MGTKKKLLAAALWLVLCAVVSLGIEVALNADCHNVVIECLNPHSIMLF